MLSGSTRKELPSHKGKVESAPSAIERLLPKWGKVFHVAMINDYIPTELFSFAMRVFGKLLINHKVSRNYCAWYIDYFREKNKKESIISFKRTRTDISKFFNKRILEILSQNSQSRYIHFQPTNHYEISLELRTKSKLSNSLINQWIDFIKSFHHQNRSKLSPCNLSIHQFSIFSFNDELTMKMKKYGFDRRNLGIS